MNNCLILISQMKIVQILREMNVFGWIFIEHLEINRLNWDYCKIIYYNLKPISNIIKQFYHYYYYYIDVIK